MTTRAFGRHAKGDADHANDLRNFLSRLAGAHTKDQVRDAGHAMAALKLPLRLSHNARVYGALALLDDRANSAKTTKSALLKACRSLINDLEPPKAPPTAGKENAGAVAQRTGSTSPLRPSVAANDATNDAEASSSDDDAMPQAAPPPSSDDDMAEAPAPAAPVPAAPAPAAARRGRPADQDVLEAPVRCPGKAPKLDDLMARLLKAALIEFLLGLPAHVREADVLARGKTYFAGVAGFTFATQSLAVDRARARDGGAAGRGAARAGAPRACRARWARRRRAAAAAADTTSSLPRGLVGLRSVSPPARPAGCLFY